MTIQSALLTQQLLRCKELLTHTNWADATVEYDVTEYKIVFKHYSSSEKLAISVWVVNAYHDHTFVACFNKWANTFWNRQNTPISIIDIPTLLSDINGWIVRTNWRDMTVEYNQATDLLIFGHPSSSCNFVLTPITVKNLPIGMFVDFCNREGLACGWKATRTEEFATIFSEEFHIAMFQQEPNTNFVGKTLVGRPILLEEVAEVVGNILRTSSGRIAKLKALDGVSLDEDHIRQLVVTWDSHGGLEQFIRELYKRNSGSTEDK
jgi:hypothetical protein